MKYFLLIVAFATTIGLTQATSSPSQAGGCCGGGGCCSKGGPCCEFAD
jgi:hypothetical protein